MATTTTRDDCGVQTLALLRRSAGLRGFVGACIVRGGRSLLTLQPVPGVALPWTHHVWAIGPDGVLQDPTADGLLPDSIRQWYEPPAQLEQLRPVILWGRAAQAAALARLRPLAVADSTPFEPIEAPGDLIYLPGRVSESLRGPHWHRLAKRSQTPGGFSAADLAGALGRWAGGEPAQLQSVRGFA
jgi:hypothetical protein